MPLRPPPTNAKTSSVVDMHTLEGPSVYPLAYRLLRSHPPIAGSMLGQLDGGSSNCCLRLVQRVAEQPLISLGNWVSCSEQIEDSDAGLACSVAVIVSILADNPDETL